MHLCLNLPCNIVSAAINYYSYIYVCTLTPQNKKETPVKYIASCILINCDYHRRLLVDTTASWSGHYEDGQT